MHPLPVCLLPGFNKVIFGHYSFDTGGLLIGFSGFAPHLYSTFTTLCNFFYYYLLSFNKHK